MQGQKVVASIQALRAIAVSLVVLNHFFPRAVPGGFIGVDVFFVVSGFLISSHLFKELAQGKLDFGKFYLRRARRLLPASLLVLSLTAVFAYALMPAAWQASNLKDVAAAALYSVNWWLAASAVDYFADNGAASPVNHFWSLSVEEQFYLVWPGLLYLGLLAGAAISRQSFLRLIPPVISVLLALVLVLSLISAVHALASDRAAAYFVTYARAWEFAAGGFAALALRQFPGAAGAAWLKYPFFAAWFALFASGWLLAPGRTCRGWPRHQWFSPRRWFSLSAIAMVRAPDGASLRSRQSNGWATSPIRFTSGIGRCWFSRHSRWASGTWASAR